MSGASGPEFYAFFLSKGYREVADQYRQPGQVLLTLTDNPIESPVNIPYAQDFLGPEYVKRVLEWAGFTVEEFEEWRRQDNRLTNQ